MLQTLSVWNFALLKQVRIDFGAGLNILTGESGAGKSILVDALGAVLGARLSSDAIRTGCDWLRVEAVFSLDDSQSIREFLDAQGIPADENSLIIARKVPRNGRSTILINGCHITLGLLKQLGELLVDVHGQHENLALLKTENQFRLLDGFASEVEEIKSRYKKYFLEWRDNAREMLALKKKAAEANQRLDMLHWQEKEIADARLKENEEEELEAAIDKLSHAEKLAEYAGSSYALLAGNGRSAGILENLTTIRLNLSSMADIDNSLENAAKMIDEAYISLKEASDEIRDYNDGIEFNPEKLDDLESRMDVIYRLKKKYGQTVAGILAYQKEIAAEIAAAENFEYDAKELEKIIAAARDKTKAAAKELTAAREKAAAKLAGDVARELKALGMPKAEFAAKLSPLPKFTLNGLDSLELLFSANPGEEAKSLAKIASGGELSRIALAIKSVAVESDGSPASMVFDEIDTGIGGRTAQMVAERISWVAKHKQVLCITHLPQIAAMADVHLYLSKETVDGITETQVKLLAESERINEIARMASGNDLSSAALANAREMLSAKG